jgi:predicted glutamine amidotransferase
MCGICGFVNVVSPSDRRLVAYANRRRGTEGWGYVAYKDEEWFYNKAGEDLHKAIVAKKDIPWDAKILLMHVRRSSPDLPKAGGGMCVENSHPFQRGTVTLAHNGYVKNWNALIGKESTKFTVDSDALAFLVDKEGPDILRKVAGSAACWWVNNKEPDRFHVWVWNQDFSMAFCPDGGMAFSSEMQDLKLADLWDKAQCMKPKDGAHIEIDLEGNVISQKKIKAEKFVFTTGEHYEQGDYFGRTVKVTNTGVTIRYPNKTTEPPVGRAREFHKLFSGDKYDEYMLARALTYNTTSMTKPVCPDCGFIKQLAHQKCLVCASKAADFTSRTYKIKACTSCAAVYDADKLPITALKCPGCDGDLSHARSLPALDIAAFIVSSFDDEALDYFVEYCSTSSDKEVIRKFVALDPVMMTTLLLASDQEMADITDTILDAKLTTELSKEEGVDGLKFP